MLKRIVRLLLALVIVGGAIGIAVLMFNGDRGPDQTAEQVPPPEVTVLSIAPGAHAPQAEWSGTVIARQQTELTSPVDMEIDQVLVDDGDQVSAGDALLASGAREAEWELAQAETEHRELALNRQQLLAQQSVDQELLSMERSLLDQAERSLTRERGLRDRGASTDAALDEAEAQVIQARQSLRQREASIEQHPTDLALLELQEERAEVNLARAQDRLERANPVAPFDGVVNQISVSTGQRVAAGQPLISLYAPDQLHWRVSLPRTAGSTLQARVQGEWLDMQRRSASVGDGQSTRYGEFALPSGTSWAPGEIHHARVQWPAIENTQLIPSSSLYPGNRVFLLDDEDQLEAVVVETLGTTVVSGEEYWLIDAADLPDDGQILVTRLPNALNGTQVSVSDTRDIDASGTEE